MAQNLLISAAELKNPIPHMPAKFANLTGSRIGLMNLLIGTNHRSTHLTEDAGDKDLAAANSPRRQ